MKEATKLIRKDKKALIFAPCVGVLDGLVPQLLAARRLPTGAGLATVMSTSVFGAFSAWTKIFYQMFDIFILLYNF
jgi:hypothetical protein